MGWLKDTLGQLSLEFPVRNKDISELAFTLETSGKEIMGRLASVENNSDDNRRKMRHIIGIERWGQQRLRGFLGGVPPKDEHDQYLPETGANLRELLALFQEARAKTVYLGIQIETHFVDAVQQQSNHAAETDVLEQSDGNDQKPDLVYTIAHNEFGPLSPRGWLRYLEMHADGESVYKVGGK